MILRRRDFITLLGGAAACPLAARAQQAGMPVIGYLAGGTPDAGARITAAFRKALDEAGFFEGRSVTIEYRFANNEIDRLPELAADLVRRRVAVIVASSIDAARAAQAATTTIPIVFRTGSDPIEANLVASLNRPGGNVTGINDMGSVLGARRLGLLHEMLPRATRFAFLVDPNSTTADPYIEDARAAAAAIGSQIEVFGAGTNGEIDSAFAAILQKRLDALLVSSDVLFFTRRVQVVTLATRHAVPTIYSYREAAEIGGLMSYGTSLADASRLAGLYTARILKGEKPADLPVMRSTKFEFVINLQTARTLRIDVPPTLLATADEVIE